MTDMMLPVTAFFTSLSNGMVRMMGLRSVEDRSVSEDILRLVVDEAQRSAGIDTGEGRMIKGVLDMQDKTVVQVMQPRVRMAAVPDTATAMDVLDMAIWSKYSRIPVYHEDIDHIVGVAYSKDLLDYVFSPNATDPQTSTPLTRWRGISMNSAASPLPLTKKIPSMTYKPQVEDWRTLKATDIINVPETMSCWHALQEMRKRRLHMAIVIDEYGGTSGLVTLEDLLEEVVGEIYDEDDAEVEGDARLINKLKDNLTYHMKGVAPVEDVFEALQIDVNAEEHGIDPAILEDYSTIGGLLCGLMHGEVTVFAGYEFRILKSEWHRRIVEVTAKKIKVKQLVDPLLLVAEGRNGSESQQLPELSLSNENATAVCNVEAIIGDGQQADMSFQDGEWRKDAQQ